MKLIINCTDLQKRFPGIVFLIGLRREQFHIAFYIMNHGMIQFANIPAVVPTYPLLAPLPTLAANLKQLSFFSSWFVGFLIAEV